MEGEQNLSRIPDLALAVVYGLLFILFYFNPSFSLLLALLLLSILNLLQKQAKQLHWLSAIPCFGIVQLLLAPFALQDVNLVAWSYSPLTSDEYINLSVPLVFCYTIPFFFRLSDPQKEKHIPKNTGLEIFNSELAKSLLLFGLGSEILFLFFSKAPIIGALLSYGQLAWKISMPIYLFQSRQKWMAFVVFTAIALQSWQSTLYWHLYMIFIITGIYGVALQRFKWWTAVLGIGALLVGAVTIQSIKNDQRQGREVSDVTLLNEMVLSEGVNSLPVISFFGRLNQGIHDSFVYKEVKEGKSSRSIVESFIGTALPRFLYPSKPTFSSKKFSDFTGYDAMGGSFITMSGCAEAASNFGFFFGGVFLVIWGFIIVQLIDKFLLNKLSNRYQVLSIIPYYHLLRVEVDFFHWMCGLFYGFIVVRLIIYVHQSKVALHVKE